MMNFRWMAFYIQADISLPEQLEAIFEQVKAETDTLECRGE